MRTLAVSSAPTAGPWLVAGAAFLWATAGIASRYAPPGLPAALFGAARMLIGGAALLVAVGPRRLLLTLPALPRMTLLITALALAAFQWIFFAAVAQAGAGFASLATSAAAPFAADVLAAWSTRRAISRRWWLGVPGAAAGVACLADGSEVSLAGVLLAVCGGIAYAIYASGAARLQRARGVADAGLTSTAIALPAAGLALLPALGGEAGAALLALATPRGLLVCAYLGLAATALAYGLFVAGLKHLTPGAALAMVQVQPLSAVLLGVLLMGERFDMQVVVAMALIAASSLYCSFKPAGH